MVTSKEITGSTILTPAQEKYVASQEKNYVGQFLDVLGQGASIYKTVKEAEASTKVKTTAPDGVGKARTPVLGTPSNGGMTAATVLKSPFVLIGAGLALAALVFVALRRK